MIFISEVKKTKTLSLFSIPQKRKIVHRKLTALRELFVSGKKNSQFHVPPDRKKKQVQSPPNGYILSNKKKTFSILTFDAHLSLWFSYQKKKSWRLTFQRLQVSFKKKKRVWKTKWMMKSYSRRENFWNTLKKKHSTSFFFKLIIHFF